MTGKDLFEGLSYVDERFVEETEKTPLPKPVVSPWIKVASMAACLCLIIFSLYNLQVYRPSETESVAAQDAENAMPEAAFEDGKEQAAQEPTVYSADEAPAAIAPEAPAAIAPELMVCIQQLTETGFVGTVQNNGGFIVFSDGTEITVIIDLETDPDFNPQDFEIGELVHVMYTSWDKDARTIVASILGIVDEPICD